MFTEPFQIVECNIIIYHGQEVLHRVTEGMWWLAIDADSVITRM